VEQLTHLFVKVPRPGDSETTFSIIHSSCHLLLPLNLVKCLVQRHNKRKFRLVLHRNHLMLNVKQKSF